jgi:6-phosphogluconolactonase
VLARECYTALRRTALDWSDIEVFFGDERFVPVDSPDSNEGQARRVLLDHVAPRAVHGMYQAGDLDAAARRYEAIVRAALPLDMIHLGIGPDGHTASLFPGTDAVTETHRLVVPNRDELHDHDRLTFTFPAIARARVVVVTVAGEEKRAVLARIRAGEPLPGARIRAPEVVWLVDRPALGNALPGE